MRKFSRGLRFALCLLSLAAPGAVARSEQPTLDCRSVQGDKAPLAEIARSFEAWRVALAAGDLDTLANLVTEDAEFWTHSRPALKGRNALRQAFEPIFARYEMDQEFECAELIVQEPWAFVRGTERNRVAPVGGGETVVQRQRAFSVLRRGEDGVWRFARGMTNLPPQGDGAPGG